MALTDVLRLDVGVNKITLVMQVLEAEKDLPGYCFHKCPRNTLLLVTLNQGQEVFTQRLKDDAYMGGFRSLVAERVEERDYVLSAGMGGGERQGTRQELDFVLRGLSISACGLDDLECRMSLCPALCQWGARYAAHETLTCGP